MVWKIVFLGAFMAVGVLATFEISDQRRQLLKTMCRNNGAEDKVDQIDGTLNTFTACIGDLFTFETVQREITEAKSSSEALTEVFRKYCPKTTPLKGCLHGLMDGVTPCLEPMYRDHMKEIKYTYDQLLDFLCFDDGNRTVEFITNGGLECVRAKVINIQACAQGIAANVPAETARNLSFAKRCALSDQLSMCIVAALKTCPTPTPGNVAESLFRHVRLPSCDTKDSR